MLLKGSCHCEIVRFTADLLTPIRLTLSGSHRMLDSKASMEVQAGPGDRQFRSGANESKLLSGVNSV